MTQEPMLSYSVFLVFSLMSVHWSCDGSTRATYAEFSLKNMLWETGLPIHWNNFYGNVDTEIIKGERLTAM